MQSNRVRTEHAALNRTSFDHLRSNVKARLDLTARSLMLFWVKLGAEIREAVTQTGRAHNNHRDCPPWTRNTPRRLAPQPFLSVVK